MKLKPLPYKQMTGYSLWLAAIIVVGALIYSTTIRDAASVMETTAKTLTTVLGLIFAAGLTITYFVHREATNRKDTQAITHARKAMLTISLVGGATLTMGLLLSWLLPATFS